MEQPRDRVGEAPRNALARKDVKQYIDYAVAQGQKIEARNRPAQVVQLDARRGQGPRMGVE